MTYPIAVRFSNDELHITTHVSQSQNKPRTVAKQWLRWWIYGATDNPTITTIFVFKDNCWHAFNVVKRNEKLQLE